MKNIFYFISALFIIGCGSDNDPDILSTGSPITQLDATGTVSQQTAVEAKKTIYGKWDIGNSAKSVSARNSNGCAFDYIEFTDDAYIMALVIDNETVTAFGDYVLNEDTSGNVSSVDLFFNLGTSEIKIATLTDIVVVEEGNNLSATFNIELSIPEESDFDVCNSIQGDYSADKDEPMTESTSASPDSNHAKIVKTWNLVSVVMDGQDITSDIFMDICENDYDESYVEGCTPATSISISFSAFGSYSIVFLGSNQGTSVETESWSWNSSDQTSFSYGDADDGGTVIIQALTDTSLVVVDDDDGQTFTLEAL